MKMPLSPIKGSIPVIRSSVVSLFMDFYMIFVPEIIIDFQQLIMRVFNRNIVDGSRWRLMRDVILNQEPFESLSIKVDKYLLKTCFMLGN